MADGDQTCPSETNESSLSVNLLQFFCTVHDVTAVVPVPPFRRNTVPRLDLKV
jgi:hypothetical protein